MIVLERERQFIENSLHWRTAMISRLVVMGIPNLFIHLDWELCCQKTASLARYSDTANKHWFTTETLDVILLLRTSGPTLLFVMPKVFLAARPPFRLDD